MPRHIHTWDMHARPHPQASGWLTSSRAPSFLGSTGRPRAKEAGRWEDASRQAVARVGVMRSHVLSCEHVQRRVTPHAGVVGTLGKLRARKQMMQFRSLIE